MPLSPLARGRLVTLAGAVLLCLDTPSYRRLRLSLPPDSPHFPFAVAVWRGWTGSLTCAIAAFALDGWSVSALREHLGALGVAAMLAGGGLQALSNITFTTGVALTTATNVLVMISCGPLMTALCCRVVLGAVLSRHTLFACAAGFLSVALVFAGSLDGRQLGGCAIAACCPLCFAIYLTMAMHFNVVSLTPCMPVAGLLCLFWALCALGGDVRAATPADATDVLLLLFNGASNSLAQVLLTVGSQTTPAPEVALIALLETALSPFLVYLSVGEKPSGPTIAAAVLIVITLASHAAYDMHLERQQAVQEIEDAREMMELEDRPEWEEDAEGDDVPKRTAGGAYFD